MSKTSCLDTSTSSVSARESVAEAILAKTISKLEFKTVGGGFSVVPLITVCLPEVLSDLLRLIEFRILRGETVTLINLNGMKSILK